MDKTFLEEDVKRLLSLWRGRIRFKYNESGFSQLEMVRKYKLVVNGEEREIILNRIFTVIDGYEFLTLDGNKENIEIKATVKPNSIDKFKKFYHVLQELENNQVLESIA